MLQTRWRRLRGRFIFGTALGLVGVLAVVYVWGVVNGEATAVTAATAILVFALGEYFRRRLAAQQYRWDKMAPQYEQFLELLREVVADDGANAAALAARSQRVMGEFGDKLLLWGNPKVIKAWVAMRRLGAAGSLGVSDQIAAYGRMLLAIRKEFGHSDWALSERDLFRVIFNEEIDALSSVDAEAASG